MNTLEKRTKAELIETINNLTSAIEARDKTVNEYKAEATINRELVSNLTAEVDAKYKQVSELHQVIATRDARLNELHNDAAAKTMQIANLTSKLNEPATEPVNDSAKEAAYFRELATLRSTQLNKVYTQHGNLLKVLSGTLGQALDLNDYLEKEVTNDGR